MLFIASLASSFATRQFMHLVGVGQDRFLYLLSNRLWVVFISARERGRLRRGPLRFLHNLKISQAEFGLAATIT